MDSNTVYLDVRTYEEYVEQNLPNSIHIPINELPSKLKLLSISKKIKVFCAGGARAMMAKQILEQHGFTDVVCLGSFVDAQEDKNHFENSR